MEVKFLVEDITEKLNFQGKFLKHVQLSIIDLTKLISYKNFVDELIRAIRFQILSIKIRLELLQENFKSIKNIQLIKIHKIQLYEYIYTFLYTHLIKYLKLN